jgi:hypothetical protein
MFCFVIMFCLSALPRPAQVQPASEECNIPGNVRPPAEHVYDVSVRATVPRPPKPVPLKPLPSPLLLSLVLFLFGTHAIRILFGLFLLLPIILLRGQ